MVDPQSFFRTPGVELRGQIRCGRISSSDAEKHTAQVQFFEQDGFVSHDFSILFTRPGDYSLYEKDTLVLCLILDGAQGFGFVLGAIYSESDAPPLNDSGARSVAGDDLRLGDPEASDKVALAPLVNDNLSDLRAAITAAKSAVIPNDGGLAAFTALDAALKPPGITYSWPKDVDAEKVSAK